MPSALADRETARAVQSLNIVKETQIAASPEDVWEAMLEEIGPAMKGGDGESMKMKLEAWPGGRYFRDLGNNTGHFWGHVQVIKPGKLLELCGPMFMSYAATSHVQYRLQPDGKGSTALKLTHTAVGLIDPEHASGVEKGWSMIIEAIAKRAGRRDGAR